MAARAQFICHALLGGSNKPTMGRTVSRVWTR